NEDRIAPGNSPGTLTIIAGFTQSGTGTLIEEIAGTAAGQFDRLVVNGTATLAGTLTVANFGGFAPSGGQAFDFVSATGTRTGTFTNDDAPPARPAAVRAGDIAGFAVAPPPVRGKKVNVAPVSGTVLVKLPGAAKFVPLPDEEQVPVGSVIDARHGVVRLFSQ